MCALTLQIYSAIGLDVGCVLHTGVTMYCCVSETNALLKGEFIMPAWACYTAPRLNDAARLQWQSANDYHW